MLSKLPCWNNKRVKRLKSKEKYRNHYLFYKGIEKLENQFDAINLIKLMKQVKLLV